MEMGRNHNPESSVYISLSLQDACKSTVSAKLVENCPKPPTRFGVPRLRVRVFHFSIVYRVYRARIISYLDLSDSYSPSPVKAMKTIILRSLIEAVCRLSLHRGWSRSRREICKIPNVQSVWNRLELASNNLLRRCESTRSLRNRLQLIFEN